ncbi:MAG: carboxymuconolactone decarboxylase family protein [Acidimicrobiales bacterium]
MARITFNLPDGLDDAECRDWLLAAMAAGKPCPEFQSIRAHVPGVMRSFTKSREWIYHDGVLDFDLKELLRAYIALAGDCTYCGGQGIAREIRDHDSQLDDLLKFEKSSNYTDRQKLALRYADAIMWDPTLVGDAMWTDLHAEFSEPELVEMGYWIGFTFGGQRWLRTLGSSQGQLQATIDEAELSLQVAGHNPTSD